MLLYNLGQRGFHLIVKEHIKHRLIESVFNWLANLSLFRIQRFAQAILIQASCIQSEIWRIT